MRVLVVAAACLSTYCVYSMLSQPVQGSYLFAPATVASTPRTQWQTYPVAYEAHQPTMLLQANSAQPPLAYAPAPVQSQGPAMAQDGFSYEALILVCFAAGTAAGYGAHAFLGVAGEEPTEKDITVGAAGLGGILGVVLFGSLPGAALLAAGFAYGTTKNDTLKSAGEAAAKVYTKAVDLEQEYEVVPKAKSAIDTVVTVADNLNSNYGITDKIDSKLQLSAKAESLSGKINAQKSKLTSKVDELKEKASS